ncbi:MAG: HEAT repeat domain-containing protein [Vicinamibacteraceae bacterium]
MHCQNRSLVAVSVLALVIFAQWLPVSASADPLSDAMSVEQQEEEAEQQEEEADLYETGQDALNEGKWGEALDLFQRVAAMKGSRADAALYWKAYAENKLGQRAEALATIARLVKTYPDTRYQKEAQALRAEVRRDVGQPAPPEGEADDDLKLIALQALQQSDPERSVPILAKLLEGASSLRVKERALFVLAQSDSAQARDVLARIAKGGNPDLQTKAIQYLGVHGGTESRAVLADVYRTSSDVDVKRRILQGFMVAGDRARLLTAATSEQDAVLRAEAVRQLGVMGAHDELWQLYQKETSLEVKKQILQAMFVGGNAARLIDLAKSEPNGELRRTAVRNLGLLGEQRSGAALVEIYAADRDVDVRKAVVEALFIQQNAEALVGLARKEKDDTMRREIVEKLSLIRSKVALDYLMEVLNK